MKKKLIEKVAYSGTMGTGEGPKYKAVAGTVDIGGEEHLIIEVYRNDHIGMLEVPAARIVCTHSDWINYVPEKEKWDRRKIQQTCGHPFWDRWGRDNTEIKEFAERKIIEFTQNETKYSDWIEKIEHLQDSILWDRKKKKEERKEQELQERNSTIEPVTDDFREWYRKVLFKRENFIYYKRKGRYATFTCSCCGKSYKYATAVMDSYEGQFEHIVAIPRNGAFATCECCGAEGIYKTTGRMNGVYGRSINCYTAQHYMENGAVIRYFSIEKILSFGNPERFIETEIARTYFQPGRKKVQKDYHFIGAYEGERWHYHNMDGLRNINQEYPAVYPGVPEILQGTCLQYCAIKEFMQHYEKIKLINYLEKYMEYPLLEMLVKLQLIGIAKRIVDGYNPESMQINNIGKCPEDILRIGHGKLHALRKNQGDPLLLSIMQMEKRKDIHLSEKEEDALIILKIDIEQIEKIINYMSIKQFVNRVEKYAGTTVDTDCGDAISRLQNISQMYLDYLEMREKAGYDLHNGIYAYPRNLGTAHQTMVLETQKTEMDKRLAETEENYPEIRKRFRKLKKKYLYESGGYIIRPAASASEIVMEGRTLHHCVGGDTYLRKHASGRSTILFMRFSDEPNIPYITVEISDDGEIMQWYGAYDKKPNKDKIDQWLKAYLINLKCSHSEQKEIRITTMVG